MAKRAKVVSNIGKRKWKSCNVSIFKYLSKKLNETK